MQFFKRDKEDEENIDLTQQGSPSVRDRAVAAIRSETSHRAEAEPPPAQQTPSARPAEMQPQTPPVRPAEPVQSPPVSSVQAQPPGAPRPPEQGKWNPQGERRSMNPVPRDRLPYPDLPPQRDERPIREDRPIRDERPLPRDERPFGRNPQPPQTGPARTIIDRDSHFNGNFRSDSDLVIEGEFEGEIDCKGTVIVAEGANISATVRARNAVVAGSANGDFTCDERMTVQATGEMRGKAQAATLVVEEGAFFEGEFKMGSGGFTTVSGSNFSNWQGGNAGARPPKSGANNRPGTPERRPEGESFGGSRPAEPNRLPDEGGESEPPRKDPWS